METAAATIRSSGPGRGVGRTARFTQWPSYSRCPAVAEGGGAGGTAIVERYFEVVTRAVEERHEPPCEWQGAGHITTAVTMCPALSARGTPAR
ncbi:hypothetical protein ACE1SV_63260 [Streptomyces sp. E-15]